MMERSDMERSIKYTREFIVWLDVMLRSAAGGRVAMDAPRTDA